VRLLGVPTLLLPLNIQCLVGGAIQPISFTTTSSELIFQPIYSDLTLPIVLVVEHIKESAEQISKKITQQQNKRLLEAISSFNIFAPIKTSVANSIALHDSFDWLFTGGFDNKTCLFKAHVELAVECGSACFETPENTYVVLWNYNSIPFVSYECKSSEAAYSVELTNIPTEKVFVFSKEFKASRNCTITVMLGQKWKDVYSIGIFTPASQKPVEKRAGIMQQLKKIF